VVGFDKVNKEQSNMKRLRTASVARRGVRGRWGLDVTGEESSLGQLLPSLKDLDLSESLVNDWSEVASLAGELQLKVLDLSENLLPVPPSLPAWSESSFQHLSHLVLGRMLYSGLSWQEVVQLCQHMPSLATLQVHGNNISTISPFPSSLLSSLTELDLDGNLLTSWSEVEKLSKLPRLQHLRLNGNQLADLNPKLDSFPHLRSLQLSDNQISDWVHIGNLDRLSTLTDLRFRGNPLNKAEKDEETVRQLVVARVSGLTNFNGSQVTSTERKWAEIDYLKTYGPQYLSLASVSEGEARQAATARFLMEHNRYDEMVTKFGEPNPKDGVAEDTTLRSSLVRLKVRTPQVIGAADMVKKVPASMSVAKLRALIHRLVKKSAAGAPLTLSIAGQGASEVVLDNDMRDLGFYSVSDGDTLIVKWPDVTDL